MDQPPAAAFGASALVPRTDTGLPTVTEAVADPAPAPTDEPAPRPEAIATVATPAAPIVEKELVVVATNGATNGHTNGNGKRTLADFTGSLGGSSLGGGAKVSFAVQADAPSCAECGSIMVRNGSCYKCLNCGSTSGCS